MYSMQVNLVGNVDLAACMAVAAFLLSLLALLRPWWQEREANFEVRNEHVKGSTGDFRHGAQRYIVKNHGPAAARDVEVAFRYEDPAKSFRAVGWNDPRTPVLHPGEELQLTYSVGLGEKMPQQVEVSWRDSRRRKQTQVFYPTVREIFVT